MNNMTDRPILNTNLNSDTFRSYYYLKEELVEFCRNNGIPTSGGKLELSDRIAYFLDTGNVKTVNKSRRATVDVGNLTEDTIIEPNIVCSEKHRAFFRERIGKSFSFNVQLLFALLMLLIPVGVFADSISPRILGYDAVVINKKGAKDKYDDIVNDSAESAQAVEACKIHEGHVAAHDRFSQRPKEPFPGLLRKGYHVRRHAAGLHLIHDISHLQDAGDISPERRLVLISDKPADVVGITRLHFMLCPSPTFQSSICLVSVEKLMPIVNS